ncbi:MAG: hypothetical protein VYD54_14520 [Bdellovibrionota bacterium]|nr:hypothetical protein [Bdellovibrionota bacterium]
MLKFFFLIFLGFINQSFGQFVCPPGVISYQGKCYSHQTPTCSSGYKLSSKGCFKVTPACSSGKSYSKGKCYEYKNFCSAMGFQKGGLKHRLFKACYKERSKACDSGQKILGKHKKCQSSGALCATGFKKGLSSCYQTKPACSSGRYYRLGACRETKGLCSQSGYKKGLVSGRVQCYKDQEMACLSGGDPKYGKCVQTKKFDEACKKLSPQGQLSYSKWNKKCSQKLFKLNSGQCPAGFEVSSYRQCVMERPLNCGILGPDWKKGSRSCIRESNWNCLPGDVVKRGRCRSLMSFDESCKKLGAGWKKSLSKSLLSCVKDDAIRCPSGQTLNKLTGACTLNKNFCSHLGTGWFKSGLTCYKETPWKCGPSEMVEKGSDRCRLTMSYEQNCQALGSGWVKGLRSCYKGSNVNCPQGVKLNTRKGLCEFDTKPTCPMGTGLIKTKILRKFVCEKAIKKVCKRGQRNFEGHCWQKMSR